MGEVNEHKDEPLDLAALRALCAAVVGKAGLTGDDATRMINAALELEELFRQRPEGDRGMVEWMARVADIYVSSRSQTRLVRIQSPPRASVEASLVGDMDLRSGVVGAGVSVHAILADIAPLVRQGRRLHELVSVVVARDAHRARPLIRTFVRDEQPRSFLETLPLPTLLEDYLDLVVYAEEGPIHVRQLPLCTLVPEREKTPSSSDSVARPIQPGSRGVVVGQARVDSTYADAWLTHHRLVNAYREELLAQMNWVLGGSALETISGNIGLIFKGSGHERARDATILGREDAVRLVAPQPELVARLQPPPKDPRSFQVLVWAAGYQSLHDLLIESDGDDAPLGWGDQR
jgi:hypothetical protein